MLCCFFECFVRLILPGKPVATGNLSPNIIQRLLLYFVILRNIQLDVIKLYFSVCRPKLRVLLQKKHQICLTQLLHCSKTHWWAVVFCSSFLQRLVCYLSMRICGQDTGWSRQLKVSSKVKGAFHLVESIIFGGEGGSSMSPTCFYFADKANEVLY